MAGWQVLMGGLAFACLALTDTATLAQTAPASPLDGTYAGTATETAAGRKGAQQGTVCYQISSVEMRVAAGVVSIREERVGAGSVHFSGTVTPQGEVAALHTQDRGGGVSLTGTISGNAFTGSQSSSSRTCQFQLEMTKR